MRGTHIEKINRCDESSAEIIPNFSCGLHTVERCAQRVQTGVTQLGFISTPNMVV